jgi:two-component system, OmpR family, sensor histidine kinase SenX3
VGKSPSELDIFNEGHRCTPYDCDMVRALRRRKISEGFETSFATREVQEVLDALDLASVIFGPGNRVEYFSTSAVTLGIVRDDKVVGDSLMSLIRKVRRNRLPQATTIEIPRGPIGEGTRKLSARVEFLEGYDSVIATFNDESEAERIDAVRRDFVANISHELKTPISALRTLSEAVTVASEDPQVNKFALMMQSQVERLSTLVQEIIDLSRLQDADPLLDAVQVDIDEAVDEAIDQCQVLAGTREIEIIRGPQVHASVVGDRTHLIMAFHNLIENAINYSPDKTRVAVNTIFTEKIVEIVVIDQGVGISESDQTRIFERFYRVDPARSRETGGTGLGLSIVKHVIGNHGGDVSLWSSAGVGSTFTIRLPIAEDANEEGAQ